MQDLFISQGTPLEKIHDHQRYIDIALPKDETFASYECKDQTNEICLQFVIGKQNFASV